MIKYADLVTYKAPTVICSEGNQLAKYYFFVQVPRGAEIEVRRRGQLVGKLDPASWVGIVDAWTQIEEQGIKIEDMTWEVTC